MIYLYLYETEKNKRRFEILRYAFWGHIILLPLIFMISLVPSDISKITIWIIITLAFINSLAYLIMLGILATQAKRNPFIWVAGTLAFSIVGVLVSYINMRTIATGNQWYLRPEY